MRFVQTMIVALSSLALIQAAPIEAAALHPHCEYCSDKPYTQEEADARFADRFNAKNYKRGEGSSEGGKSPLAQFGRAGETPITRFGGSRDHDGFGRPGVGSALYMEYRG
ncbi:hypothetical protein MFRU_004g01490 [Monilinia fructicola]|nr:hypothetical protein MFRU_004g01490 [Monilinia fructicola]